MSQGGLISLTFDDALPQHLDHAIPVLEAEGLHATFYTHVSASGFLQRSDDWRSAARAGHELGNHTIFHPATQSKAWVRPGNTIENYCVDRMKLELETANQVLQSLDGRSRRTFAYPCSNAVLGRYGWPTRFLHRVGLERTRWPGALERAGLDLGSTRESYKPALPGIAEAARGGGLLLESQVPPIASIDRYWIPSAAVDGHSFQEMRAFIERGIAAGSWAVLQFHGVGGGHRMDCRAADLRDLVAWLAEQHRDCVVTVLQGASNRWPAETTQAAGKASVHA